MDWSLVLTSQRIEAEILAFPDGRAPYGLRINPLDRLRAMQAILRFQKENKGWHWHQELPAMGLRYDWSAWGWCILLSVFAWLAWEVRPELQQMGMLKSQEVLRGGALVANHHRSHAAWRCRSPCFQSDLRDHYSGSLHGTLWDHPRPLDCPDLRSHGQRMELVGPR